MKTSVEHLYIHVPFCTHICPYCAFYKHKNDLPSIQAFLPALKQEFKWAQSEFNLDPQTIYFGGGTPSALSLSQLEILFTDLPWEQVPEFTFECNPATISKKKARLLHEAGVNRISLGVQSFHQKFLKLLGRTHTSAQVEQTLEHLRAAGFENISIDLMFALPGQTLEEWEEDLKQAVACEPSHLSAYNLNFEEDTEFFSKLQAGVWQLESEKEKAFFVHTIDFLRQQNYHPYEISNFAHPGWESLHNQAYWEGKDYLGLGPSACSTVGNMRWQNVADTLTYAQSVQEKGRSDHTTEVLSDQLRQRERIFLGLRTARGVALQELEPWIQTQDQLIQEKLAFVQDQRLRLTPQGLLVADSISEIFV